MTSEINHGGSAFPTSMFEGLTKREYFAIHAPMPNDAEISNQSEGDRLVNPHNDYYKPPLSWSSRNHY